MEPPPKVSPWSDWKHPHGIDVRPLQSRLAEALCTVSGRIQLAPEALLADVPRLSESVGRGTNGALSLIGRRHVRSNNSWMHNVDVLVSGRDRWTLQVNTGDAPATWFGQRGQGQGLYDHGHLIAPVEVTENIMPGVVSLPHGWGHDLEGSQMEVAAHRPVSAATGSPPGQWILSPAMPCSTRIPVEVVPA